MRKKNLKKDKNHLLLSLSLAPIKYPKEFVSRYCLIIGLLCDYIDDEAIYREVKRAAEENVQDVTMFYKFLDNKKLTST